MLDDALQQQLVARHSLHGTNDVAAHGAEGVLLVENSGAEVPEERVDAVEAFGFPGFFGA